ncbi:MAG: hypothetical protein BGN97_05125 [Microbacterium sp. 69-10]|uniref:putative quinol monooxygenase n=1 Tax=Microbacterium sp. 69-10 TaxID=1895783 RepID=UPI00095C3686|nr:antibiotic biosynthesis monooxygenase [Microbacterium sp. 69-10]OJU40696.1 MAG: hypothetical protein BGN97_05125 [Microbacterium sp. 69-10]
MHISILRLHAKPGTASDIIDYYRHHGILDAADCLWSHLAVEDTDPDTLIVVTGWSDLAQMQRWYSDPRRQEWAIGLAAFIASMEDVSSSGYGVRLSSAGGLRNSTLEG